MNKRIRGTVTLAKTHYITLDAWVAGTRVRSFVVRAFFNP